MNYVRHVLQTWNSCSRSKSRPIKVCGADDGGLDDDLHRSRVASLLLSNVRIIVTDGFDVGWVNVRREETRIEIYDIYIQPEHQNKGIGSLVVQEIIEEARRKSVVFALVVLKVNPARRFYEKLGMICMGENQTHYFMELTPA